MKKSLFIIVGVCMLTSSLLAENYAKDKSIVCIETVGIEELKPVNLNICVETEKKSKYNKRHAALMMSVSEMYNSKQSITTLTGQSHIKDAYKKNSEVASIKKIVSIRFDTYSRYNNPNITE